MKNNVSHVVIMSSLAGGNNFQGLDTRHNPFQNFSQHDNKGGKRMARAMKEVRMFTSHPYVLCDFNIWNYEFASSYPVRSMFCGELQHPRIKIF